MTATPYMKMQIHRVLSMCAIILVIVLSPAVAQTYDPKPYDELIDGINLGSDRKSGAALPSFAAGLASDAVTLLAGIIIDRVEAVAYSRLTSEAVQGLEALKKIELPNKSTIDLVKSKAFLQSLGLKSIISNPKAFLGVFLRELAHGIVGGFAPPSTAQWLEWLVDFQGEMKLDASEIAKIEGLLRDELKKLVAADPMKQEGWKKGFAIATIYFLNNPTMEDPAKFQEGLEGELGKKEYGLGNSAIGASASFGITLNAVHKFLKQGSVATINQTEFLDLATSLFLELASYSNDGEQLALLELAKDICHSIVKGDYELAATVVEEISSRLSDQMTTSERHAYSVISSAAQYGLYFAAQGANSSDASRLREIRKQILTDFIASNTSRDDRGQARPFVLAIEGDLGVRTEFQAGWPKTGFANPYSLCFGLSLDWYACGKWGLKAQLNALDLGSYLTFDDAGFALDKDISLEDALIPSLNLGVFYDAEVLVNLGCSFGFLPRYGTGERDWTPSLRFGASVPLYDFN
jgi:hypothetical protein